MSEFESILLRIEGKIDALPCVNRGERLVRLEQININGEKQEGREHDKKTETFGWWRIALSAIGVAIVILQVIGMIK